MNIDSRVLEVLNTLNLNGIEAYLVGGSLRDLILGKTPTDYDIAYNETPFLLKQVFSSCKFYDTGIKYGTVTMDYKDLLIELTVFRSEGRYSDGRHPDSIKHAKNIYEDLKRRDFTANAICYNPTTGFYDPFSGARDISKKVLKTVGNPSERFKEDALRIFRATRFLSVLGFNLDKETKEALINNISLVKDLSKERVLSEVKKTLKGDFLEENFDLFVKVLSEFLNAKIKDEKNCLNKVLKAPKRLKLPLLLNAFDVDFNTDKRLNLSKKQLLLYNLVKDFNGVKEIDVEFLLLNYSQKDVLLILDYLKLNGVNIKPFKAKYDEIIKSNLLEEIENLAINGLDIIDLGYEKTKVSEIKTAVLKNILSKKIKNQKEEIINFIKENF